MKVGIFQFNPETKSLNFCFVSLIEIGKNYVIIEQKNKIIRLDSDYIIRNLVLTGDETVILAFERDGKLWPLNFSEFIPLNYRFLPPPKILEDEQLYSDPEFCALLDEQRQLISEILCELERQQCEQPFEEILTQNNAMAKMEEKMEEKLEEKLKEKMEGKMEENIENEENERSVVLL